MRWPRSRAMSGCALWSFSDTPANLCTSASGSPFPAARSDPFGVIEILPPEAVVRPEDVVFRHVGRVAARRRLAAERLGHGADVMRPRAAAHAQITDVDRLRRPWELVDLPT